MIPPKAAKIPHPHTLHGDVRPDDYYWLRERENPAVIAHLTAENEYADSVVAPLEPFVATLADEMRSHMEENDTSVPVQDGPYFYYTRTREGQQYPIYARRRAPSREALDAAPEDVLLDQNERAAGKAFLSITVVQPSPDHRLLAFLENDTGTDRYTLYVKDLQTGALLSDVIPDVFLYGSLAWSLDGSCLFYVTTDAAQRPYRLYRHRLGNTEPDALLYEETDNTFTVHLRTARSGRYLFLVTASSTTSEIHVLPADSPNGTWTVVRPRTHGIEYDVEHWQDAFVMLTNEDGQNFSLRRCPVDRVGQGRWDTVLESSPTRYLQNMAPFSSHLVISGREGGLTQIWTYDGAELHQLTWDEPLYTVDLYDNRAYVTDEVLVSFESLVTPPTVYGLSLATGERTQLKRQPVPHYDSSRYHEERVWATASDGERIPISLVYRPDLRHPGAPSPVWLYGYGSYGATSDPEFRANALVLLDRGVIFAIAHVRGGSEMGRAWYDHGKLLEKRNTFTDFIAAGEELVRSGLTRPEMLVAEGRSAGGLLMGAVTNLQPDLFAVVVAGVPFVDVVTTMLDDSIPLTSLEWEEWGNPADSTYYAYMKSYSPYDNVTNKAYPHIVVTTGLNDPRVGYFEPAKWVQRLRELKTDQHDIILKTHMGAGHGGSSGRYDRQRELAMQYAFALARIGVDS